MTSDDIVQFVTPRLKDVRIAISMSFIEKLEFFFTQCLHNVNQLVNEWGQMFTAALQCHVGALQLELGKLPIDVDVDGQNLRS